jgi:heat shock protein HslJ
VKGCGGSILSPQTLAGTEWRIDTVAGVPALADRPASISFAEGRIAGTSGCNRFSGPYDLNTTVLTLGPVAATKMACPGTAMDQETKLFAILKGSVGMRFRNGDTLILTGANGQTIVLKKKV